MLSLMVVVTVYVFFNLLVNHRLNVHGLLYFVFMSHDTGITSRVLSNSVGIAHTLILDNAVSA